MNTRILLVARRDFLQLVRTRAFKLTLLIVPALLGITAGATSFLRPPATVAYVMADEGGRFAPVIEQRLELDYQRQLLRDLSAYAARWNVAPPGDGWADDASVAAFVRGGGVDAALARMQLPAGTPAFKRTPHTYLRVPAPPGVPTHAGAAAFGDAITPLLAGDVETPEGKRALSAAIYIPAEGAPRIWTNGRANGANLIEIVQEERSHMARVAALAASGLDPVAAARIDTLRAPLMVTAPPAGGGRAQMQIRSAVPLALVYLLLMAALITGGMMLQGVIEERSNRLLEAVLACVEPRELMLGKLLGLGAVGLTILAAWVGCGLLAAFAIDGVAADYLRPSLAALNQPWMIPAMIFYFFTGYLILAMAYLAIGSLSDSMQDAQAYLMPVTMGVLLPVMLMVMSSLQNPGGWLPEVMSWIPLYTPFAMLARMGMGVSLMEVLGTGILLVAFVALELLLLGRVFRASLLNTGQPPKLGAFVKLMLRPD
jgi:ABC-2 type transport system permease protein